MKENDILQAQDVRFRYDTEQPNFAVDGVSMEVHRGEFVAVLGANGCGKSTLAKHFNAILLPESGTVLVEDMDTRTDEKLYDIRQKVGMVFQNPDNQIVATVVEEDVAFALENLGVPTGEMRTRVDDAMKLAGIYEQRNKAPHKLSGGQKQRVAIAGVIAMRPDCLILDESTAMLDPRGRAQVMKTIRNLRDAGISIVSITHYMEEAAQAEVELRMYRVIYDAIEEMEQAMKGMLEPKFKEVVLGHAEVRQVFKITGAGAVAGCYVQDGKIQRNAEVRVVRDGIVFHEGHLNTLKRFKDDVKEVATSYECGMSIENYNDIKEGDIIECFVMEEVKQ